MEYCIECGLAVGEGGGKCVDCGKAFCRVHVRKSIPVPNPNDTEAGIRYSGYYSFKGAKCYEHRQQDAQRHVALSRAIRDNYDEQPLFQRIVMVINGLDAYSVVQDLEPLTAVSDWPYIAEHYGVPTNHVYQITQERPPERGRWGRVTTFPPSTLERHAWRFPRAVSRYEAGGGEFEGGYYNVDFYILRDGRGYAGERAELGTDGLNLYMLVDAMAKLVAPKAGNSIKFA